MRSITKKVSVKHPDWIEAPRYYQHHDMHITELDAAAHTRAQCLTASSTHMALMVHSCTVRIPPAGM